MNRSSLRRTWAVARKETLHVIRDPWSLGMAIVIPIMMLLLFGYALTVDVDNVPMVVWDQSQSALSRDLISRFDGSRYFSVRGFVSNYAELDRQIDNRLALMAVVIGRNFAGRVESGSAADVQVIFDGSDSNTATLAMGYARAVFQAFSQEITLRLFQRKAGGTVQIPLDLRPRIWYNADLESRNYIVPGLIAISMMIIAALLTSLTVAREWERGTMEQLISTPVRTGELMAGKLAPYFAIGMFDMLLVVLTGQFLFQVPLRGSILLLTGVSAIFLLGVLGMGLFISIATRNQLMASQLAMITTFLPAFLLSGFIYPIANMPRPIQWITVVIPARYFIELLKGIYLKGVGLDVLGLDAALLAVFAVFILWAAHRKFRKKLS